MIISWRTVNFTAHDPLVHRTELSVLYEEKDNPNHAPDKEKQKHWVDRISNEDAELDIVICDSLSKFQHY